MAVVTLKGIFLGASYKERNLPNKAPESYVQLDIYQPDSDLNDKQVTIKVEDVSLLSTLSKEYSMGSPIEIDCSLNAYQNKAYFKLLRLVKPAVVSK
jgi:hypothetical protein